MTSLSVPPVLCVNVLSAGLGRQEVAMLQLCPSASTAESLPRAAPALSLGCGELEVTPGKLRDVGATGRSRRVFSALQTLWTIPLQETLTSNRFK